MKKNKAEIIYEKLSKATDTYFKLYGIETSIPTKIKIKNNHYFFGVRKDLFYSFSLYQFPKEINTKSRFAEKLYFCYFTDTKKCTSTFDGLRYSTIGTCPNEYFNLIDDIIKILNRTIRRINQYGLNYNEVILKLRETKNLERRLLKQKDSTKKEKLNKI